MPAIEPIQTIELLVEAVRRLSLAKGLAEVTGIVVAAARGLTAADAAAFIHCEDEECLYVDEDSATPLWKGQRFPIDGHIGGWVIRHGEPVTIPDVLNDIRVPADDYRHTFVRGMAMVPIGAGNPANSFGALGVYWSRPFQSPPEQLRLLQALAASTAVAIDNIRIHQELEQRVHERTEELESANEALRTEAVLRKKVEAKVLQLSLTDELTGLNNRRGFLLRAEQLLKLVHRVRTFGWLVYIDLDGLKKVNDDLGHDAGDRLITTAAKVLRESFRDSDVIGRIGGDEFVVFATGSSTPVVEVEERLKRNIAHHNQCFPGQPALSMSIGVTRCDPQSLTTLEDMIHQADAAMYIEKRRKRRLMEDISD